MTGSRGINILEPSGSNAVSVHLVERYLLAYEEFSQFSPGEAVVRINGQHPIRTQLAPMTMAYVEGTGIKKGSKKNLLHAFYQDTLTRCPGGLVAYTTKIINQGQLIGSPPPRIVLDVVPTSVTRATPPGQQVSEPQDPATRALPQPTPAPVNPERKSRAEPGTPSGVPPVAPATGSGPNLSVDEVVNWLRACMEAYVEITFQQPDKLVNVRTDTQDDQAVNSEAHIKRLVIGGLLERTRTHSHVKLTKRVQDALPADLAADLADYPDAYAAYRWLRENANVVAGTPERVSYQAECAVASPPLTPLEVVATLEDGHLICTPSRTREIFRGEGTLKFEQRRLNNRYHHIIPMTSLADTAKAVRAAREAEQGGRGEAAKSSRRQTKAQGIDQIVQSVMVPPPVTPEHDTLQE